MNKYSTCKVVWSNMITRRKDNINVLGISGDHILSHVTELWWQNTRKIRHVSMAWMCTCPYKMNRWFFFKNTHTHTPQNRTNKQNLQKPLKLPRKLSSIKDFYLLTSPFWWPLFYEVSLPRFHSTQQWSSLTPMEGCTDWSRRARV